MRAALAPIPPVWNTRILPDMPSRDGGRPEPAWSTTTMTSSGAAVWVSALATASRTAGRPAVGMTTETRAPAVGGAGPSPSVRSVSIPYLLRQCLVFRGAAVSAPVPAGRFDAERRPDVQPVPSAAARGPVPATTAGGSHDPRSSHQSLDHEGGQQGE